MKKLPFILSFVLFFFATGCRDIVNSVLDALPPFTVPFNSTFDVPFAAVSTTTYTKLPEIPMNIDLNAEIKEQNANFSIDNLKSVKLSSLTLDYVSSQLGNKLDVIKNARIYVRTPNRDDQLIATVNDNANPEKVTFSVSDAELLDYFRTTQNSLVIEIQASRATADQLRIKMSSGFFVKVQL